MTKVEELEQEILEEEKKGLSSKLKELYRKRDLLIEKDIDKDIYHKKLSNDAIINVAGESGSGKSTLCEVFKDKEEFLIIDTDLLDSYEELVKYFDGVFPEIFDDFDKLYQGILDCYKDSSKIIVIDSTAFKNIKDISLLKGEIFILRTCPNTCYNRCIKRYDERFPNSSFEEKSTYYEKKKKINVWYKNLNEFILRIDGV